MSTKKTIIRIPVTLKIDHELHESAKRLAEEIGEERGFSGLVERLLQEEQAHYGAAPQKQPLSSTPQPESKTPARPVSPVAPSKLRKSSAG